MITKRIALLTFVGLAWLSIVTPASGQTDLTRLGDEAVQRVQEYLRINTINPPGNESRAVEFFARIFDAEGIEYETAESAPGRGNIWARLEGGDGPALEELGRIAAADVKNAAPVVAAAVLHLERNRLDAAARELEEAGRRDEWFPDAERARARLARSRGDARAAQEHARRARVLAIIAVEQVD